MSFLLQLAVRISLEIRCTLTAEFVKMRLIKNILIWRLNQLLLLRQRRVRENRGLLSHRYCFRGVQVEPELLGLVFQVRQDAGHRREERGRMERVRGDVARCVCGHSLMSKFQILLRSIMAWKRVLVMLCHFEAHGRL